MSHSEAMIRLTFSMIRRRVIASCSRLSRPRIPAVPPTATTVPSGLPSSSFRRETVRRQGTVFPVLLTSRSSRQTAPSSRTRRRIPSTDSEGKGKSGWMALPTISPALHPKNRSAALFQRRIRPDMSVRKIGTSAASSAHCPRCASLREPLASSMDQAIPAIERGSPEVAPAEGRRVIRSHRAFPSAHRNRKSSGAGEADAAFPQRRARRSRSSGERRSAKSPGRARRSLGSNPVIPAAPFVIQRSDRSACRKAKRNAGIPARRVSISWGARPGNITLHLISSPVPRQEKNLGGGSRSRLGHLEIFPYVLRSRRTAKRFIDIPPQPSYKGKTLHAGGRWQRHGRHDTVSGEDPGGRRSVIRRGSASCRASNCPDLRTRARPGRTAGGGVPGDPGPVRRGRMLSRVLPGGASPGGDLARLASGRMAGPPGRLPFAGPARKDAGASPFGSRPEDRRSRSSAPRRSDPDLVWFPSGPVHPLVSLEVRHPASGVAFSPQVQRSGGVARRGRARGRGSRVPHPLRGARTPQDGGTPEGIGGPLPLPVRQRPRLRLPARSRGEGSLRKSRRPTDAGIPPGGDDGGSRRILPPPRRPGEVPGGKPVPDEGGSHGGHAPVPAPTEGRRVHRRGDGLLACARRTRGGPPGLAGHARSHRAEKDGEPSVREPETGNHRPAGERRGPRVQQLAGRHHGGGGDAVPATCGKRGGREIPRHDRAKGGACRGAAPPAPGVRAAGEVQPPDRLPESGGPGGRTRPESGSSGLCGIPARPRRGGPPRTRRRHAAQAGP